MATSDTLIDQVFDGRYRVIRKLGTGGMANVYLAEDQELGRRVAIKMLDDRHAQDEQFVERFQREAKNAAVLSHPNIVAVYDRGVCDGTYYIAMEYLEGKTLKEHLVARGPTPARVAIDYTRQILAALDFAHRHGIVHRDIKPHNVVVAPDGRLKVTDFGIARSGTSQMTEVGSIIGTAQYLSPEQARGAAVSPASDIYSAGVVLYEMLTGTVPFTGDTPLEIAMKHLSEVPEPPSKKRSGILPELDAVVLRALAKDPAARYRSAREMDADLARVAAGLSVSPDTEEAATAVLAGAGVDTAVTRLAGRTPGGVPSAYGPPSGRYYDYERPVRRRQIWPWLLAALLVAAAGIAAFYVYTKLEDEFGGAATISVPFVEGIKEERAIAQLRRAGLVPDPRRRPNAEVEVGKVFDQKPGAGKDVEKGSKVVIFVSSGLAKTTVPDVRGKSRDEAVAELTAAKLKANVVEVYSSAEPGTVTGQDPAPQARVPEGETVRINVSKGIKLVTVPSVVGETYDEAVATLEGQGFSVGSPRFENADTPENEVIAQDPAANSQQRPGTTVRLTVSKGPAKIDVPDVEGVDAVTARSTLRGAGFKVSVVRADTDDPNEDGFVIAQFPGGGTKAEPGSTVTITVARYVPPPPETTPTDTTPVP